MSLSFKYFVWSALDRIGFQILQVITLLIVSRILSPSDFGLMAIVTFFTSIGIAIIENGFTSALIQKTHATNKDYNTVFIFSLVSSIVIYAVLFLTAPYIATYYNEASATMIVRFIGLMNIFSALSIVHLARLNKALNFKRIAKVNVLAALVSGVVAIILAFRNFQVWTLVGQTLVYYFMQCLLLWYFEKWRPKLQFDFTAFKDLFHYGYKLLGASLLEIAFQNSYILIIVKKFSPTTVGIFSQARRLSEVPAFTISSIIQQVIFPSFSLIQNDNEKLRYHFSKVLRLLSFFTFPFMFFLAVVSKPLVYIFLSSKWAEAVPYFQIFFVTNMLLCIHVANLNILKVRGRTDLYLRAEIFKKVVGILLIFAGLPWGMRGLMASWVLTNLISYVINAWFCNSTINYTLVKQLLNIFPAFILAVFVGLAVHYSVVFKSSYIQELIIKLFLCIGLYLALSWVLRLKAFCEAKDILMMFINKVPVLKR